MSKIYEIDPEADTLVIVRPPDGPFAPWPTPEKSYGSATAATNGVTWVNGVNGLTITGGRPAVTLAGEVWIKVSSKHLSLASAHFHDHFSFRPGGAAAPSASAVSASLWGGKRSSCAGAVPTPADGRMHIVLDGLDGDATITVLNIVHGRAGGGRVPKTVDLDTLARIAVVVDRFRLQEAVDVYADRWIGALYRRGLPTRSGRALVLWMYVAYVFQRDEIFRETTQVAVAQSTGALPTLAGLPLRAKIVQDVDAQRQHVIGASLDLLHGFIDALVRESDREGEGDCIGSGSETDGDAGAVLLGILIKTLRRSGLTWPRPDWPYAGISVAAISRAAHDVQTQVWRLVSRVSKGRRRSRQLLITPQLDALRAGIAGLALTSSHGYQLY